MKRVLLTAFEPFGGQTLNPSQEVACVLRGRIFEGITLETQVAALTIVLNSFSTRN